MQKTVKQIILSGRIPSKKNSKRIVLSGAPFIVKQLLASGKLRPMLVSSNEYVNWQESKSASVDIKEHQNAKLNNVKIVLTFYAPDKRKADLSNKTESVMDLLVDNGIIVDDNWFTVPELLIKFGGVDKFDPRVEIEIIQL